MWHWSVEISDAIEVAGAYALVVILAILIVLEMRRSRGRSRARFRRATRIVHAAWIGVLVVAMSTHVLRSRGRLRFGTWDLFHTVINAKYLPELGYFRLYDCAYQLAFPGDVKNEVHQVRDLRLYRFRSPTEAGEASQCAERFTSERLVEFRRDVRFFLSLPLSRKSVPNWVRDFGYFGTPVHAMAVRFLFDRVELNERNLILVSFTDDVLIALALIAVFMAFGVRAGLLTSSLLALSIADHTVSFGGSILRQSYVGLVVGAAAMLKLERPRTAGALLALATADKLFPGLFFIAVVIREVARYRVERRISRDATRFAGTYAGVLVACVALSLLAAGGVGDWAEFVYRIVSRELVFYGAGTGLKSEFMLQTLDFYRTTQTLPRASWLYYPTALVFVAVGGWLCARRLDAIGCMVLYGLILVFTLTSPLGYYLMILTALGAFCASLRSEIWRLVSALWIAIVFAVEHTLQVAGPRDILIAARFLAPLTTLLLLGCSVLSEIDARTRGSSSEATIVDREAK